MLFLGARRVVRARGLEVGLRAGGQVGGDGTAGLLNEGLDGFGPTESQADVVVVVAACVAVSGQVKRALLAFNGFEVGVDARGFTGTDHGLVKIKVNLYAGTWGTAHALIRGEPGVGNQFAEFAQGGYGRGLGARNFSTHAVVSVGLIDLQRVLRGQFALHLLDVL